MYDRHLLTFLAAADCGSFLKAADRLYISANAVTKQVALLEKRLDVRLFDRSTRGLVLTDAGRLIYNEAKKMIRHSDAVLQKAHALAHPQESIVRIGASLMNPSNLLLEQWERASARHPNIKVEIIPFEDTVPAFSEVLDHLGEQIDLIPCPYQNDYWGDRYQSFHLMNLPVCIACSRSHPLAAKKRLTVEDLYGETVVFGARTAAAGALSARLQRTGKIRLVQVDYYDFNLFNRVVADRVLIVSAPCWSGVHPLLATLPVDWDFTIAYGLICSKQPRAEVLQFIGAIGSVL